MNKDDILLMAQKAGFTGQERKTFMTEIVLLSTLVIAAEREKCAKAIEELMPDSDRGDCASAIRARGKLCLCDKDR